MPDEIFPLPFNAYNGSDPYIFISYAHRDSNLVFPEIKKMHERGVRIWFDGGIEPGNEWPEDIANALINSDCFVVFISPFSVESINVRNEINFAINKKKPFIAVHLKETTLPGGLELRMGDIQAILKYKMNETEFTNKILRLLSEKRVVELSDNTINTKINKINSENNLIVECVNIIKTQENTIGEDNSEKATELKSEGLKADYDIVSKIREFYESLFTSGASDVIEKYSKILKQNEKILFIYDGTLFGSAKDGFLLTNLGVGWSETWGTPKYSSYDKLVLEHIKKGSNNEIIFVKSLKGAYVHSTNFDVILKNLILFFQKMKI
jgi:hypothetical protein